MDVDDSVTEGILCLAMLHRECDPHASHTEDRQRRNALRTRASTRKRETSLAEEAGENHPNSHATWRKMPQCRISGDGRFERQAGFHGIGDQAIGFRLLDQFLGFSDIAAGRQCDVGPQRDQGNLKRTLH